MNRPNIVFILADDMGYGDFACFNHGASQTPHLDALMKESVCLTQHYSASAVCAPSRAGLLTGRYPLRTGVVDTICLSRMDCLATRETTMGDVFRRAGYRTSCIGKWHLGSVEDKYHPNARGFDEFVGFRGGWWDYVDYRLDYNGTFKGGDGTYLTDQFTHEAVAFIKRNAAAAQPFFLHLAYNAPHTPFQAPEEDLKPFLERGAFNKGVSYIYAMIRRMDAGVGRVLETLKRQGLEDNTIVIFTSDNGPQFNGTGEWDIRRFNCGFRGAKSSVHEGGIRVPLMIRWPAGLEGNRQYHDLVHSIDWLPTLAAMSGTDVSDLSLDGQNILPALRGEGGAILDTKRFWQWSRRLPVATHNAAMRDGDWKLVRPENSINTRGFEGRRNDQDALADVDVYPETYADGVPESTSTAPCLDMPPESPLLFNLAADPLESSNLADDYPEVVSRMIRDLENWFDDVERDRRTIEDKPYRDAAFYRGIET